MLLTLATKVSLSSPIWLRPALLGLYLFFATPGVDDIFLPKTHIKHFKKHDKPIQGLKKNHPKNRDKPKLISVFSVT